MLHYSWFIISMEEHFQLYSKHICIQQHKHIRMLVNVCFKHIMTFTVDRASCYSLQNTLINLNITVNFNKSNPTSSPLSETICKCVSTFLNIYKLISSLLYLHNSHSKDCMMCMIVFCQSLMPEIDPCSIHVLNSLL